jgi:hypothetical protein
MKRHHAETEWDVYCPDCDETHLLYQVYDHGSKTKWSNRLWPYHARYKYRGWCPIDGELVGYRDSRGQCVPAPDM